MTINPFHDDNGGFFVSVTEGEQHRWSSVFAELPSGGRVVHGESDRTACVDNTEQNWADVRRRSLREGLAAALAPGK